MLNVETFQILLVQSVTSAIRSQHNHERFAESSKRSLREIAEDEALSGPNPEGRFIFINICELIKYRAVHQESCSDLICKNIIYRLKY